MKTTTRELVREYFENKADDYVTRHLEHQARRHILDQQLARDFHEALLLTAELPLISIEELS